MIGAAYTVAALASQWGVSKALIYKLCRESQLRHFKIGVLIRIPQDAAQDYLACQTSHTPSNAFEAATPLSGSNQTGSVAESNFIAPTALPRTQRRGNSGPKLRVVEHGQSVGL